MRKEKKKEIEFTCYFIIINTKFELNFFFHI